MLLRIIPFIMVLALAPALLPPRAARASGPPPEWGEMTTYYVGFLYRGPKWTPEDTPELQRLQDSHLENIRRLVRTGKLLLAGPFTDDGELRGLFVFRVDSLTEARALCDSDPAIQAGRLRVDLRPWYAPKGLRVVAAPDSAGGKPGR
jgi:uncharacterized protein